MSKRIEGEKLEQRNRILKEAGVHLRKERDGLQVRHEKQSFLRARVSVPTSGLMQSTHNP